MTKVTMLFFNHQMCLFYFWENKRAEGYILIFKIGERGSIFAKNLDQKSVSIITENMNFELDRTVIII